MAFKIFVFLALAALANGGLIPETTTVVKAAEPLVETVQPVLAKEDEEYDAHPQYRFAYDVHDSVSGDSKGQVEERDGDVVRGEYSLVDADGFKRTVKYTADPINGFQADVQREPVVNTVLPTVVKTVAEVAPVAATYAAPVAATYSAPIAATYAAPVAATYSAPIAATYAAPAIVKTVTPQVQYAAPVAHYAAPSFVKTLSPVGTYASSFVRNVAPVTHYTNAPAVYASYSAPTTYFSHY